MSHQNLGVGQIKRMLQDLTLKGRIKRHKNSTQVVQRKEGKNRLLPIKHPNSYMVASGHTRL